MKLWQKDTDTLKNIEQFTVGKDRETDLFLAKHDVLGSLAHIHMLESINLIEKSELTLLSAELKKIYKEIESGTFTIQDGVEDIHSQVELLLTQRLGDIGKKIHSGRSRNDQVLVDLKLYLREEIETTVQQVEQLFTLLQQLSEKHKDTLLPGYTHLQLAMPSSFGLWFGAYAESLADDMIPLQAAYKVVNKNPLGSGAGYGSSFPLNRQLTTDLLGFDSLHYNVVYAQMGRGKAEYITAHALANIAATLSRFSMDVCLYLNQNFGFISFPDHLTTGSSIMPHKKNPDVFELIRARCNRMKSLPAEIAVITTNLPSGYHRDLQLIKENMLPVFGELNSCLSMAAFMLQHIEVKSNLLDEEKYTYLFTVERVNALVLEGLPFRDAYKQVGREVENGTFRSDTQLTHTHEGSMGNLMNKAIKQAFDEAVAGFRFDKKNVAIDQLLS